MTDQRTQILLTRTPARLAPAWGVGVGEGSCAPAHKLGDGICVRRSARWSRIEPRQGAFAWAWPDGWVAEHEAHGVETLAILSSAPTWAAPTPQSFPDDLNDYLNFARAFVSRYKGRIAAYEVWNEPLLWGWTPEQTKAMHVAVYPVIKDADPAALVVGVAKDGFPVCGKGFAGANAWFDAVISDPAMRASMDVLSWHTYTRPNAPEIGGAGGKGAVDRQMQASMALLAKRGWTGPCWVTEGGWPTATGKLSVSEDEHARYIVRMAIINRSFADRFYAYTLHSGTNPDDEEANYGLLRANGTEKPAFQAYRTLNAIIGPADLVEVPLAPDVRSYRFACGDGAWGYVLWTVSGSAPVTLQGLSPAVRLTKLLGQQSPPVLSDDGTLTVTATVDPLYVESIP
jgi:hypothetical protein